MTWGNACILTRKPSKDHKKLNRRKKLLKEAAEALSGGMFPACDRALDVQKRRTVQGVEASDPNVRSLEFEHFDHFDAYGVRAVRTPRRKYSFERSRRVAAGMNLQEFAIRAVEPVEDYDALPRLETDKGVPVAFIDDKPSFR